MLLVLLISPVMTLDRDLANCCPNPMEPCTVRHPCCIQLCSSLSVGVRLGEEYTDPSGCCPDWDPCGEEGNICRQCNCPERDLEEELGVRIHHNPWEEEQEEGGLERESGKEFLPSNFTVEEEEGSGGGLGVRINTDFLFGLPVEEDEEYEEENPNTECCPTPSSPCAVRHPCCIKLCSLLSLAVRGALGSSAPYDGCCPDSDPCGELPESGNCIHCDCHDYDMDFGVGVRISLDGEGWEEVQGGGGLVRESGAPVEDSQVRLGGRE